MAKDRRQRPPGGEHGPETRSGGLKLVSIVAALTFVALFPDTVSARQRWPPGLLPGARGRRSPAISILGIDRDQTHGRFEGSKSAKRLIFLMESASLQRRVHKNEFRFVAKGGQPASFPFSRPIQSGGAISSRLSAARRLRGRSRRGRRNRAGPRPRSPIRDHRPLVLSCSAANRYCDALTPRAAWA